MDATTSFLDEASVGMLAGAVALSLPAVVGAALQLGCGKKRAPVKGGSKSKKGVAGKSGSKSSKAGSVSKSKKGGKAGSSSKSKSGKSGKAGASSKRSKSSKSAKSGKGSKSSKSKKGAKSKKGSGGSSSKQLKGGKQESSLKERSTQSSSAKVVSAKTAAPIAPASGAGAGSQQGAIEAERASARAAHVAAAQGVDASLKSAKTQSVSIKEPQGTPPPPSSIKSSKSTLPRDPPEPLVPLEVQLLPQFYAGEVLLLPPAPGSAAPKGIKQMAPGDSGGIGIRMQVPRTLLDSAKEIKMEPAELRWSSTGGMQKISLVNQTAERQAIKVKCSDNNVYRVNPVYAFVEPGQTLNVDVMRQNGSNKVDKIVFVTAKAPVEEANPKVLFKPGAPSSMMVLPLLATATPAEPPAVAAVN